MPERYLKIKQACIERGGSEEDCEELAARIYNDTRKPGEVPMGPNYEERVKKHREKKESKDS